MLDACITKCLLAPRVMRTYLFLLDWNSFDEWQPYDVADLLKQFFRELPECLLTNALSSSLINIFHRAFSPNLFANFSPFAE